MYVSFFFFCRFSYIYIYRCVCVVLVSDLEILSKQKREKLHLPRVNKNNIVLSFQWNAELLLPMVVVVCVCVEWLRLLLGALKKSALNIFTCIVLKVLCVPSIIKHLFNIHKYIYIWFSSILLSWRGVIQIILNCHMEVEKKNWTQTEQKCLPCNVLF